MGAEWIDYKGKKILYINYGGLQVSEMIELVKKSAKLIADSGSSENLTLTDMNNCHANEEFMTAAKENSKISLPLSKKAAIVGVTGVKKILLMTMNNFTSKPRVPFNTIEEAKEWLVE